MYVIPPPLNNHDENVKMTAIMVISTTWVGLKQPVARG